jgi:hypothetical protein
MAGKQSILYLNWRKLWKTSLRPEQVNLETECKTHTTSSSGCRTDCCLWCIKGVEKGGIHCHISHVSQCDIHMTVWRQCCRLITVRCHVNCNVFPMQNAYFCALHQTSSVSDELPAFLQV